MWNWIRYSSVATCFALLACGPAQEFEEHAEYGETSEPIVIDTSAEYTITGVQSGKCVEIANASTADGARVQISTCTGQARQRFRMEATDSGFFRIRNVGTNKCLDVTAASTADAATFQQYSCWSGQNQQFSFTDVTSDAVRITARHSGKVMDVNGRGTADGTQIIQWPWNSGTNQQFRVARFGGSTPPPSSKFVGNITTNGQVRSDFVRYWRQITPENEGKWGSVEGQRNVMNWAGMDRVRDYARQNNIPYKGHTLVWGAQQPGWLANLSQSEQRREVEEWIRLFCQRYPDVAIIDVVNEPPPHTTPVYMNALGGAGASGYDWIVQAFRWARQYCPNATLLLNDYNNIEYDYANRNTIDIVNRIRAAGAPIDGIGAQAHAAYSFPTSTVKMYLDRLAATGLPVYITEYDINLADDWQQRTVMESQFQMFYNHPSVRGITLWGYVSGSTWLQHSGLMSSSGQQRPAMTWLMNYLGR